MRGNRSVAEAFIHHKQAKGSHMYTDGMSIWSYGSHFPIGSWRGNKVLVTTDKYSRSTSNHQSKLRYAISSNAIPSEDVPLAKVQKNVQKIENWRIKKAEMEGYNREAEMIQKALLKEKAKESAEIKRPLTAHDKEVLEEVSEEGNFLIPIDYNVEPFSSKRFIMLEKKGYLIGKLEPEGNMKRYALTEKGKKVVKKRIRA